MNTELLALLEKAKTVKLSASQLEEQRINIVAANGYLTDSRITLGTVKATRTIMMASEQKHEAKE